MRTGELLRRRPHPLVASNSSRTCNALHRVRAYLTAEDGDPEEVVVYCPDCAEREFGDG